VHGRLEEASVTAKLEFFVTTRRVDASGSVATCKDATLALDTALAGRRDALNPAELLLAALSACMIKGIERVAPC
jgi:organic hydroperoxide reductase OsmC/OhrA